MLLHLAPRDQGSVVVEVHLHAVAGIIGHKLSDHGEPVGPHLRVGVGEPGRAVELRLRVVRLRPDLPLGMLRREVGHAAVRHTPVIRVIHVEKDVRQELESPLLGVLADQSQGVGSRLDHLLGVHARAVPDLVVRQIDVVAPPLAHLGIVQQHAAVADRVGNRIDSKVDELVYRLDVLPLAHRRLVEIDARMASVGIEHYLVAFAHSLSFHPFRISARSLSRLPVMVYLTARFVQFMGHCGTFWDFSTCPWLGQAVCLPKYNIDYAFLCRQIQFMPDEGTERRIQAPLLYTPLHPLVWYRIGTRISCAERN